MEHRITICTSCRHRGNEDRPGFELIERLRQAIAAPGSSIPEPFEISAVSCMAGCEHPCTVAYHGTGKATYLFGNIDPKSDIADLIAFARHYAGLPDGWCSASERPGKLRTSTLARVPATLATIKDSARDEDEARAS